MRSNKHRRAVENAIQRITPFFPLKHFVAVNPYFGLRHMPYLEADALLQKVAGERLCMHERFYLSSLDENGFDGRHILEKHTRTGLEDQLLQEAENTKKQKCYTLSEYFQVFSLKAWQYKAIELISSWCAVYFDQGQAFWRYPKSEETGLYAAWLEDAKIDRSIRISGLKKVKDSLSHLSSDYKKTTEFILEKFNLSEAGETLYLHRLLMQYHGWASYVRQRVWTDELNGKHNTEMEEFVCVLLSMEYLFFNRFLDPSRLENWRNQYKLSAESIAPETPSLLLQLHNAYEKTQQNRLISRLNAHTPVESSTPIVQAAFCIDVRSEVLRRHLEAVNEDIQTIGFAGFFGAPFRFEPITDAPGSAQCPALITPTHTLKETLGSEEKDQEARDTITLFKELKKTWLNFKMGAISCFSFMSPIGIFYLPIMIRKMVLGSPYMPSKSTPFTWKNQSVKASRQVTNGYGISITDQAKLARNVIKGMSIKTFGKLVILVGHESVSQNNPYESALDCGACGGHSGRRNAEIMSDILNDPDVRKALNETETRIPEGTFFLGAVHNTATDDVTFINTDQIPETHKDLVQNTHASFKKAGQLCRTERAVRFNLCPDENIDNAIIKRSRDWSQVRPEWGLAGCNAFIVGPREFTKGLSLEGRAFLHSYTWKEDANFSVLESILTAPAVVASWINLQYFASMVSGAVYRSGNKVLHNVTSGIGVLEGSTGDLRVGLPIQSIHDGKEWQHSPERLNVLVAAPHDAITAILEKHEVIRQLFKNQWIHLFSLSDNGKVTHQYTHGNWCLIPAETI